MNDANSKNSPLSSPFSVILNLTTKCNLSCLHCFGDYGERTELALDELKRVVDELDKNKVFYLNLTGGEPTQHPNFKEFIDYLGKKNMFFMLTTNGLFSRDAMGAIIRNKKSLINVKISLDGPDAESNGFIRRKEGANPEVIFERIIGVIKEFNKEDIPVTISTVLHSRNIKRLDDFDRLFRRIKIERWLLSPITFMGRAGKNRECLRYDEELKDILKRDLLPISEKLSKRGISVALVDFALPFDYSNFHFLCGASVSFCEIHADGTVSPCALARYIMDRKYLAFENILKKPLKAIWNGKPFNQFRKWQNSGCSGCKNFSRCNRCVPQGFLYFKDGKSPPPFCISIGENLHLKNLKRLNESGGYKKWAEK